MESYEQLGQDIRYLEGRERALQTEAALAEQHVQDAKDALANLGGDSARYKMAEHALAYWEKRLEAISPPQVKLACAEVDLHTTKVAALEEQIQKLESDEQLEKQLEKQLEEHGLHGTVGTAGGERMGTLHKQLDQARSKRDEATSALLALSCRRRQG